MPEKDYYKILNIPRTAGHAEVKKGYHHQALLHHPDKNPNDPQAADRFKLIVEAYQVLGDEIKRATYDAGSSVYAAFVSDPISPEYLKAEVDLKKVKLNEEVELTFSFPGEGRFFRKPILSGWVIAAGPTVGHRYEIVDGHSIRETTLHYTVCPIKTGLQIIPPAQIHFHNVPVYSQQQQIFVEENECYFKAGEKAGNNPFKVKMHRMQVTSNTIYRKTIVHYRTILIPRSDLACWYHKVGRTLKISFALMGVAFAATRGESAFLGGVAGSLLAGIQVHSMYYFMGIRSRFYYAKQFPDVIEYIQCGYEMGESPYDGLVNTKRLQFLTSLFY